MGGQGQTPAATHVFTCTCMSTIPCPDFLVRAHAHVLADSPASGPVCA